jgi:hypothetical protein
VLGRGGEGRVLRVDGIVPKAEVSQLFLDSRSAMLPAGRD